MLNLLKELVARARCSDEGVTTVEYAVMLALIVIAVTSFGLGISGSVTSTFPRMLSILGTAT